MGLIAVFLLVFGVFMSLLLFNNQISSAIRATTNVPSCPNSYIFVSDVDATEPVSAVVFARNSNGNGVSRVPVTCNATLGEITPANQITDNQGNANFIISSTVAGTAVINCSLSPCGAISQAVSVRFNP